MVEYLTIGLYLIKCGLFVLPIFPSALKPIENKASMCKYWVIEQYPCAALMHKNQRNGMNDIWSCQIRMFWKTLFFFFLASLNCYAYRKPNGEMTKALKWSWRQKRIYYFLIWHAKLTDDNAIHLVKIFPRLLSIHLIHLYGTVFQF